MTEAQLSVIPKYVHKRSDTGKWRAQRWDVKLQRVISIGHYDTMEEASHAQIVGEHGHHWQGLDAEAPGTHFGFIYEMSHRATGRKYIGSKQFVFWDGPQGGYKLTDRSSDDFDEKLWRPSDWKDYRSSSETVKSLADKTPWAFEYRVLSVHRSKLGMHLGEIAAQQEAEVLTKTDANGDYVYWNSHIAGCEYRPAVPLTKLRQIEEETAQAMRAYYMRPKLCDDCGQVIPFRETQCPNKPMFGSGRCTK